MNEFINSVSDPFDSDNIPEFYHCKSLGYGGDRKNLTVPSTPNFPPLTPARYYVDLPYIPDQTNLTGTRPMLIKDVTGGVALTRVTSSPSTNQYRLAAAARERNYVIEVNSAQAGHVIAYDYYTARQPVLAADMGRLTTVETRTTSNETKLAQIQYILYYINDLNNHWTSTNNVYTYTDTQTLSPGTYYIKVKLSVFQQFAVADPDGGVIVIKINGGADAGKLAMYRTNVYYVNGMVEASRKITLTTDTSVAITARHEMSNNSDFILTSNYRCEILKEVSF